MSRNGSGTYTLPAGNPVVTGTTISSTWANNTLTDIATALTGSLSADGQTTATGALQMGSNKITNVAVGTVPTDVAVVSQVTSAVAITGGTIDGTTVGTTTRSTVKATTLDLGLSTQSVAIGQGNSSIMKNRIINGAMVIDQRNAGASVTASVTAAQTYTLDRWAYQASQASKFTIQQNAASVTPPVGFKNYLGITSSAATSIGASDYFLIDQCIEGYNIADLGWGTANAKTVTLSFQIYSSLTGTFGGSILNNAANRSYPFTYTISSANTWTTISITIAGDTSGTWLATNGTGMFISFGLGMGSTYSGTAGAWAGAGYYSATGTTSVVGTSGATFYITGVQLEVGSSATGYEYRVYGTELANCQRYLPVFANADGAVSLSQAYLTNAMIVTVPFPVTTRIPATGIVVSSASHFNGWSATISATGAPSAISFNSSSPNTGTFTATGLVNNNLVAGNASALLFSNASAKIYFTGCEL
jgi:hypothetical protein